MKKIDEVICENKGIEEGICYCCEKKYNMFIEVRNKRICRACAYTYFKYTSKIMDFLENSY